MHNTFVGGVLGICASVFLMTGLSGCKSPFKKDDPAPAAAAKACGSVAHGAMATRTRYQSATAVYGLASCVSETQAGTCNNGVLNYSGTYTHDNCSQVYASVEPGDILVMDEKATLGLKARGEIKAYSPTTGFKGVAFAPQASPTQNIVRYPMGLKIDPSSAFGGDYHLNVGTFSQPTSQDPADGDQIWQFPELLNSATTLTIPAKIANTGSSSGPGWFMFMFAFSENYSAQYRYMSDYNGSNSIIRHYFNGGTEDVGCRITLPQNKIVVSALWKGMTMFENNTGQVVMGWFGDANGVTDLDMNVYGVSVFNDCTTHGGTTPGENAPAVSELFHATTYERYPAEVSKIRCIGPCLGSGTSGWEGDVLVTLSALSGAEPAVERWHYNGSSWAIVANSFVNNAMAFYRARDHYLYTVEYDSSATYLRRYRLNVADPKASVETLYTDSTRTLLQKPTYGGMWMAVIPSS